MFCGGGEGGIRTHVPVTRQHAFEARPLRPLRYLSVEEDCVKRTLNYSARRGVALRGPAEAGPYVHPRHRSSGAPRASAAPFKRRPTCVRGTASAAPYVRLRHRPSGALCTVSVQSLRVLKNI